MRAVFDGEIAVDHSQFYVMSAAWTTAFMDRCFAGQRNGLCGAGLPGGLWLNTGLLMGEVGLRIEVHADAPSTGDGWEDVVEASFVPVPDLMLFDGRATCVDLPGLDPAPHRVRYCGIGMDAGRAAGVRDEDDPPLDRYLLQLWPAPPAADTVLRQTSDVAAYWHDHVADLPPADEVARRAVEDRRAMGVADPEPHSTA